MPLPPHGDPQRELMRAADETNSLGLAMVGLGALAGTCFMSNLMMFLGGGVYLLSLVLSCGGFGLFYVYAARHMRRGRAWAPSAILIITAAQAAWVLGYLGWSSWRGRFAVVSPLALPSTLWLAALGVVAYYATRAARAIRLLMLDGPAGFEVPINVLPVTGPPAAHGGAGDEPRQ